MYLLQMRWSVLHYHRGYLKDVAYIVPFTVRQQGQLILLVKMIYALESMLHSSQTHLPSRRALSRSVYTISISLNTRAPASDKP
jgi:hypothetical protein